MHQDETWHAGRPRPWPHCFRWGPSSPSLKGEHPQFLAYVYCGQTAGWTKMPLAMELGLGPRHYVRWDQLPQKGAQAPTQFSAHVHCGQTAAWIKMPVGTEVGLGPGDVVLDGDPAPQKGHSSQFSAHVYCGQMAGWMKTPLCTEVDLGTGHIVLDEDPAPPRKGHRTPPLFGPCLLRPRSPISPTALLLKSCFSYHTKFGGQSTVNINIFILLHDALSAVLA